MGHVKRERLSIQNPLIAVLVAVTAREEAQSRLFRTSPAPADLFRVHPSLNQPRIFRPQNDPPPPLSHGT